MVSAADLYPKSYFFNELRRDHPEFRFWHRGQIRYGDQCAAIGYALGVESFEAVRKALGFAGDGKYHDATMSASEQVSRLVAAGSRSPKGVVDVGGGRGEVSLAFSHAGVPAVLLEPCFEAEAVLAMSAEKLGLEAGHVQLVNGDLAHKAGHIDWSLIDTLVFCESIEHIPEDEFEEFYREYLPQLQRNQALLVVTNWIGMHPIAKTGLEHCRAIDDAFYGRLSRDGTVVFQQGSHFVMRLHK